MLDLIYKDWLKQKYQIYNLQQLTSYINNLISLAETLGFYQLQKDLQQLSTTLKDSSSVYDVVEHITEMMLSFKQDDQLLKIYIIGTIPEVLQNASIQIFDNINNADCVVVYKETIPSYFIQQPIIYFYENVDDEQIVHHGVQEVLHTKLPFETIQKRLQKYMSVSRQTPPLLVVTADDLLTKFIKTEYRTLLNVYHFTSGKHFFTEKIYEQFPFFILIVDWMMPQMDGLELINRLKRLLPSRHFRIFMTSTKSTAHHLEEAFKAGADDFIEKPFSPLEFKVRLAHLLEGRNEGY